MLYSLEKDACIPYLLSFVGNGFLTSVVVFFNFDLSKPVRSLTAKEIKYLNLKQFAAEL